MFYIIICKDYICIPGKCQQVIFQRGNMSEKGRKTMASEIPTVFTAELRKPINALCSSHSRYRSISRSSKHSLFYLLNIFCIFASVLIFYETDRTTRAEPRAAFWKICIVSAVKFIWPFPRSQEPRSWSQLRFSPRRLRTHRVRFSDNYPRLHGRETP